MNQSIALPTLHQSRSLYLRRTVPNDAGLLFHKGFSQREFMRLFRLNDTPTSEAEVHRQLVQRQQLPPNQDRYLEVLIVHKRHGAIGLAALADYAPLHRRAEYLIGLFDPTHRGVGMGLETTLMMLDLAFNTYKLHKVYASTYDYNPFVPQQGLEGFGFSLEGKRKEHIFDPVAGCFIDLCDYGMTENNFRQNDRLVPLAKRLLDRDITQPNASPQDRSPSQAPQSESATPRSMRSGGYVLRPPPSLN